MDIRVGETPSVVLPNLPVTESVSQPQEDFGGFFNAALDVVQETNDLIATSDRWQVDLATGRTDDILSVLLAQQKAQSALNFTVQITNKIIESYREIMRMQV